MKRVEAININGIVFSIDDDAYDKLGRYLDALGKYFEDEQGGREIIFDIEARIAELFTERSGGAIQVVTPADVVRVIETLGTPEDIADTGTEQQAENETSPRPVPPEKPAKRLYRDPDHRYLGGVCSGVAAWLGIPPAIIRLVFLAAVFFYGTSVFIYVLLWVIIPKAKTTAQKLKMRGEPVTIGNIEKNIKESLSDPSLKQSFRNFLNEAGEFIGKLVSVIWRVFTVLLGLWLCCVGIGLCIGAVCLFFMQDFIFHNEVEWDLLSFTELFRHVISPASYTILSVCAMIISVLLIAAFLYWGVKFIAGFEVRQKLLHITLMIVWFVAIITGVSVCFSEARMFAWHSELPVETKTVAPADTLYLTSTPSQMHISNNPMDVYFDKDNQCFYGKPGNLSIYKSEDGKTKLRLYRESQGESKRAAYRYAENIEYSVDIRDSLLTFPAYFTVTPQDKWKFQTLEIALYIPEGTVVVADKTLCHDRILGRWLRRHPSNDCTRIMTENDGLQPLNPEK